MEAESRTPDSRLKRETIIVAAGLAFGLFVLPFAIYIVGQRIFGEYSPDGGLLLLVEHIWSDLLAREPSAWALVLSPYVVVQLGRIVKRLWRVPRV
jgi:hypothetical protein